MKINGDFMLSKKEEKYHLHQPGHSHAHSIDNVVNHEHHHDIDYRKLQEGSIKILKIVIFLTFGFALIEFIGGHLFNSLALISDAAHMLTDSSSLLIALIMAYLARRPADHNHSYGHGRSEVIGALVNAMFMFAIIIYIFVEAVARFQNPVEVKAIQMMIVASIGLLINIGVFYVLQKDNDNVNIKAALLHVLGDLLGSVAAIGAAIIIYFTGWNIADPILSVLVGIILIPSTFNLVKKSLHILAEGVPEHVDFYEVGKKLEMIENVESVHDLHIWTIDSKNLALTAHIHMSDVSLWPKVLEDCQKMLYEQYNIVHVTLQPEMVHSDTLTCVAHER